MKQKHKRMVIIGVLLGLLAVTVAFILYQLKDSLIFFYSPTELQEMQIESTELIRVGGLIKKESVVTEGLHTTFSLTDYTTEVHVDYTGILPQLFREGQGMVVLGYWSKDQSFVKAQSLLAKHDENYMPREVMDALKAQGHWQGE